MPEIGETKRDWPKNHCLKIWASCPNCGKTRWVASKKGIIATNYRCLPCVHREQVRENHPNWRGGRHTSQNGYIDINVPKDDFFRQMASRAGYVFEHRLVMAKHIGRCLHRWEIVHHRHTRYPAGSVEDKQDNRIENLQLVSDDRHRQITLLERRIIHLEKRITLLEVENAILRKEDT